jgi:hypothetical protein
VEIIVLTLPFSFKSTSVIPGRTRFISKRVGNPLKAAGSDGKSYAPPRAKFHADMRHFAEITGKFSGTFVALTEFKCREAIKASRPLGLQKEFNSESSNRIRRLEMFAGSDRRPCTGRFASTGIGAGDIRGGDVAAARGIRGRKGRE